MLYASAIVLGAFLFTSHCLASSSASDLTIVGPVITENFPDPSVIYADGKWYAFATNNGVYNVPVAESTDFLNWTVLAQDALPDAGVWSDGTNVWAPDVVQLGNEYIMYYTATIANGSTHCVSAATATSPVGPYTPLETIIACPALSGGAIDPAGFADTNGDLYLVYKIDANSLGLGGNCNNGIPPIKITPIMLQPLEADGLTPKGCPTEILQNGQQDGPLVEAPSLVKVEGTYYLFYSRNCYSGPWYVVAHATASSIYGPYTKALNPSIATSFGPDGDLYAPGGATVVPEGDKMVFHADLGLNSTTRQMYVGFPKIRGGKVII